MAHLFIIRSGEEPASARTEVAGLTESPRGLSAGASGQDPAAQIVPFGDPPEFALVAPARARVRINGEPLRAGIRVLGDRDEIRLGDTLVYFAAYSPPRVTSFSEAEHGSLHCPICTRALSGPVVRCPRCGRFFCETDETEEFPCWTGGPTCPSGDGQPTALGAEFDWVPEVLQEQST